MISEEPCACGCSTGPESDLERLVCSARLPSCWFSRLTIDKFECVALIDTGAARTILDERVFEWLGRETEKLSECSLVFSSATGEKFKSLGSAVVTLCMNGECVSHELVVAKLSAPYVLLGNDFFEKYDCVLHMGDGVMTWRGTQVWLEKAPGFLPSCRVVMAEDTVVQGGSEILVEGRLSRSWDCGLEGAVPVLESTHSFQQEFGSQGVALLPGVVAPEGQRVSMLLRNTGTLPATIPGGKLVGLLCPAEGTDTAMSVSACDAGGPDQPFTGSLPPHLEHLIEDTEGLSSEQKQRVRVLLWEYQDIFIKDDEPPGRTTAIEHRILTKTDEAIKVRPRRMPLAKRQIAEDEVKKMLAQGIIEPSESPYSAPVVLVRKKNGSWRFCVDYRKLNNVTIKDSYSLPNIEDIFDALGEAEYFSCLDLASGYWQIAMHPDDKEKTAFTVGNETYQYMVMAFGLCNAPASFQRAMDKMLADILWKLCLVFLDDINAYGKNFDKAYVSLEEVCRRVRNTGLKFKAGKCKLFRRSVEYLGHQISNEGVSCSQDKVKAVQEFETPGSVKDVQAFLGLVNYYRKFIPQFSSIAYPLSTLTRKEVKFAWDESCETAFQTLKDRLISAPILGYPLPDAGEFILDTDASNSAAGAVLSQLQEGREVVIAYASTTFNKAQRGYCTTYRELYAVVWSVKHFNHYLWGRKFKIRSDHSALRWLLSFREPEGMVARWIARLDTYDFEIEHRPGLKHGNADALSRIRRRCLRAECDSCASVTLDRERIAGETIVAMVQNSPESEPSSWLTGSGPGDIKDLQMKDKDLSLVLSWKQTLDRQPDPDVLILHSSDVRRLCNQWNQLQVTEGFLLRRRVSRNPNDISWTQIVVPESLRREMFHQLHELRVGGHLGIGKTYKKLRERYYWPGMKSDVTYWTKHCVACQSTKMGHGAHKAELCKMLTGEPLDRIALDFVGPLPVTERGNEHLLVVTDYFTKWVEAYPLPDQLASTTADALVTEFFARWGVPRLIHTDQGPNFQSDLFKEMCQRFEITQTRTCPYWPRSDGQTERANRTLQQMLKAYVDVTRTDWDDHIPYLLMAYRSSVHDSTGFTPNRLMLGREIALPSDIMYGKPPNSVEHACYHEFVHWFDRASTDCFAFARENLAKTAIRQKRNFDTGVTPLSFECGDKVWFFYPPKKRKLSPGWIGPFEIELKFSEFLYRIRNIETGKYRVTHVDNLRPFVSENADVSELFDVAPPDVSSDSDSSLAERPVPAPRRTQRQRRPPAYLADFETDGF